MNLDPVFVPSPSLDRYTNDHLVLLDEPPPPASDRSMLWLIAPLLGLGWARRRGRRG